MADHNVFCSDCPSRVVLERAANKWTLLVIGALSGGPMQFGELSRAVGGITRKMLAETLRKLERDGLITRTVQDTRPPTVRYELTPLGAGLKRAFAEVRAWAEENQGAILAAREAYDRREAGAVAPA